MLLPPRLSLQLVPSPRQIITTITPRITSPSLQSKSQRLRTPSPQQPAYGPGHGRRSLRESRLDRLHATRRRLSHIPSPPHDNVLPLTHTTLTPREDDLEVWQTPRESNTGATHHRQVTSPLHQATSQPPAPQVHFTPTTQQTLDVTTTPVQTLDFTAWKYPGALAQSTLTGYLNFARRFEKWASDNRITDLWDESAWVQFIATLQVRPQGEHQYLKIANAILQLRTRSAMALRGRMLQAQGALTPHHQAPAIRATELDHPVLQVARLPVLLAWATASRWDEVSRLTTDAFISMDPLILDWHQNTKASRMDPHRASRFTTITGQHTNEIRTALMQLHQGEQITHITTAQITRLLKAIRPALSAHSFKAGAADVLARGVVDGTITEAQMARLLKHKHHADPNTTTLRYIRDHVTLALLLGTGEASRLL
jgi:hypothetical protein